MHKIDRLELLANVSELGREANALLAEAPLASHTLRVRRIIMLLDYIREHLEMVYAPAQRLEATQKQREVDQQAR